MYIYIHYTYIIRLNKPTRSFRSGSHATRAGTGTVFRFSDRVATRRFRLKYLNLAPVVQSIRVCGPYLKVPFYVVYDNTRYPLPPPTHTIM